MVLEVDFVPGFVYLVEKDVFIVYLIDTGTFCVNERYRIIEV